MMKLSTKILLSILIILIIANIVALSARPLSPVSNAYPYTTESTSGDDAIVNTEEPSGELLTSGDGLENIPEEESGETLDIPEPTQTPTPTKAPVANTSTKKLTSSTPYYIKVNNRQNVVNIYTKNESGEYTIPYKAMVCSVGDATPAAGKMYKTTTYKNRWNGLVHNVYGQYITQIIGDILFHSVPYTAKDVSTLEYWEYDKLGEKASAGCVRLTVEDAKWIYDNIEAGTIVEFYEDDDPGPFGKPAAQKISDNERCRDWDPTDPTEGNPWNTPEEPEPLEEPVIETTEEPKLLEESLIIESTEETIEPILLDELILDDSVIEEE